MSRPGQRSHSPGPRAAGPRQPPPSTRPPRTATGGPPAGGAITRPRRSPAPVGGHTLASPAPVDVKQPAPAAGEASDRPVQVAAAGDLHLASNPPHRFRRSFTRAAAEADVLLLAGDLTASGHPIEAHQVAYDVERLGIPVIAVLGNRDHHSGQADQVTSILAEAGVTVLEGAATVVTTRDGLRLGVAGVKGYGGGFGQTAVCGHGEPQTEAFLAHAREAADRLATALSGLECHVKVALTHYAPTAATLDGEPRELYPLLGSELLGQAIDASGGVGLAVHGHAHHGNTHGHTPGGVPVHNVAYPLIRTGYHLYRLRPTGTGAAARDNTDG